MSQMRSQRTGLARAASIAATLTLVVTGIAQAQSPAASAEPVVPGMGDPTPAICEGNQYVLGYDVFSDTENFAAATIEGMNKVAGALGCVELVTLIDNADPIQAVANAKTFIQRQVDGAMLFNVIAAAGPGQATELNAAGIPLTSIVVKIDGAPFLGVNEYNAGYTGGEALAKAFAAKYPDETPYAINGRFDASGADSGIPRMDGFRDGIKSVFPDLPADNYLEIDTAATPATASANTLSVLNRIPADGKIILGGINDENTYAMFQATKQAGRQDNVMVMGIGGVKPTGLEFVCQNPQYAGVVGFFPENWPAYMLPTTIALIQGKPVPAFTGIPTEIITRDNIHDFYPDFAC